MKTKKQILAGLLALATASCTTWYTVQRDQLPVIAKAFESGEAAEITTAEGTSLELTLDRGFRIHHESGGLLFSGKLKAMGMGEEEGRPAVAFQPRGAAEGRLRRGGWVVVSEVESVDVEVVSIWRTALVTVGGALATLVIIGVIDLAVNGLDLNMNFGS